MNGHDTFCCLMIVLMLSNVDCGSNTSQPDTNKFPEGHPQRCAAVLGRNVDIFEVLPGGGWDNLANEELGQILRLQYRQCRVTEDGAYLIPDSVNVIPVKESNVGLFAEFTKSMTDYKSATSSSINTHVSASCGLLGIFGISGSFAKSHQSAKMHMYQSDSTTVISRVTARYNLYRVITQPDMPLAPALKKRVLEIAESFQLGHKAQARYLSQALVRDFGTHVITSVDAGAMYTKDDFLTKSSSNSEDVTSKSTKIGAGMSFAAVFPSGKGPLNVNAQFGIDQGSSSASQALTAYQSKVSHSTITTYGGQIISLSSSNSSWFDSLSNNLVPVDRHGQPIHDFITTVTFPELPTSLVVDVQNGVMQAFIAYYKHNTYRGCTDPSASNFDVSANVESGACKSKETGHPIGGVFQTCQMLEEDAGDLCPGYLRKNPLTQEYSCPDGYSAIHLVQGTIQQSYSQRHCKGVLFWKECHQVTTDSSGVYDAYWCAPTTDQDMTTKMYFGGMFTSQRPNDLTGKHSCPNTDFQAMTLGEDISVCVGSTPIDGYGFGGMFGCNTGNVLAINSSRRSSQTNWPMECPANFSRKFLTIVDDCDVEFCSNLAEPTPIGRLPALLRPPFVKQPHPNKKQTSKLDVTLIDNEGEWFINDKAYEKMSQLTDLEPKMKSFKASSQSMDRLSMAWSDLAPSATSSSPTERPSLLSMVTDPSHFVKDGLSTPVVVVISSLATAACIGLATMFGLVCRRRYIRASRQYKYTEVKSIPVSADDDGAGRMDDDSSRINITYGST